MKSLTLYELRTEYRAALDLLAETPEDEIDMDSFSAGLAALESDLSAKAAAVACYIREVEAEAAAIGEWLKAQQDRARRLDATADRLRNYLFGELTLAGLTKVSDPQVQIKIRKNPPRVAILSEDALPPQWWRTRTIQEPDKIEIKAALKAGQEIPGAALEITERLEIK
jgi:hypothetical protein